MVLLCLAFRLMTLFLLNGYILFKKYNIEAISIKQFRLKVARQLIRGYSKRSHRARQRDITDMDRLLAQHHTKTVFLVDQEHAGCAQNGSSRLEEEERKRHEMVALSVRSIMTRTVSRNITRSCIALISTMALVKLPPQKQRGAVHR